MEAFKERTKPYLKANEVQNRTEELRRLQEITSAPPHVRGQIQDRGALVRRRRNIERDLAENEPKPYSPDDLDSAVKRESELREKFTTEGMPTQAEMRRAPPGAVDKHMGWEKRNKKAILEWKNIRRRLHAGGHLDEVREAIDVSNAERFRPNGGAQELNMDRAIITGKQYYFPPSGIPEIKNVMNDEDRAKVLYDKLRIKAEAGDETAKALLADLDPQETPKQQWNDEKRKAASERMKRLHAEGKLRKKKKGG